MLSQMPAGTNKSDLIYYLGKYFSEFYFLGCKSYYGGMAKTAIGYSYFNGWKPAAALLDAFQYVCEKESFVWAVQRNAISVVDFMDWVVINIDQDFTRSHIEFIESSKVRKGTMQGKSLITGVVSYMNSDIAFDPPYTDMHEFNFNALNI